jgi:hypothetical protein
MPGAVLAIAASAALSQASPDTATVPDWLVNSMHEAGLEPIAPPQLEAPQRATFTGSGIPVGGSEPRAFYANGAALGLHSPPFVTCDIGAGYVRRFLSIGFVVGAGGAPRGAQQSPMDPTLASRVDAGRMAVFTGAADLAAVLFHDPATLRVGALVGARYVTAPLLGFDDVTCDSRHLPCAPRADATVALLQPRASLDFVLGRAARVPALGAYVGMDAYPQVAWCFGLSFSFRTPHWNLAP